MITRKVSIPTIEKVKEFIHVTSKLDADLDLASGRHIVDAKSIMGVLSMDLTKPLNLNIYLDDSEIEKLREVDAALGRYYQN